MREETNRGIIRIGGTMLTEIVRIKGRQITQNRRHWNRDWWSYLLFRQRERDERYKREKQKRVYGPIGPTSRTSFKL